MRAPASIQATRDRGELVASWPDGHHARYPFRYLREQCGCAVCVHEITGERLLDPETIPADIHVRQMKLVGNYAIKIEWSDNHDIGLFTWEQLRKLCQCETCRSASGGSS